MTEATDIDPFKFGPFPFTNEQLRSFANTGTPAQVLALLRARGQQDAEAFLAAQLGSSSGPGKLQLASSSGMGDGKASVDVQLVKG